MGQVIPFKAKSTRAKKSSNVDSQLPYEAEAKRLMAVAKELDGVILHYLDTGSIDPRDIAGLMAHRLGTLLRHIDEKERLWSVCEEVLRNQAALAPRIK